MLRRESPTGLIGAFASPISLTLGSAERVRTACICMKTKRGGAAREKGAARSKRASSAKSGFSSATAGKKNDARKKSSEGKSIEEPAARKEGDIDAQVESTSGASGDATPHRVRLSGPVSAQLEDPQRDSLEAPLPPLVELPDLSREEKVELRFDRTQNLDQLIESFADAREGENFEAVVKANRDLITERLLYRFTSAILQVESRNTGLDTKAEEAANMRSLRKDLIACCWSHDHPLKIEIQEAEARLLAVLQGTNVKKDIARNCGQSRLEVNAFWIVIYAAIAAWEERGRENPQLANVDMQTALADAADACQKVSEMSSLLSPALKAVQTILSSPDPQVQAAVVADLDDPTIEDLGSLTEQIRLFPTPAYGALCRRMSSIMDYVLNVRYQVPVTYLDPLRFKVTPVESESGLVEFSRRSRNIRRRP